MSDWSSYFCSSALGFLHREQGVEHARRFLVPRVALADRQPAVDEQVGARHKARLLAREIGDRVRDILGLAAARDGLCVRAHLGDHRIGLRRSEEHTSELQSLMRLSYAVFCFKK